MHMWTRRHVAHVHALLQMWVLDMDLLTPTFPSLSAPQVVYSICSILQHLLYIVHIQYITVPAVVMLCIKEKQKSQIAALRVALGYIWSFNFAHSQKVESRASIAIPLLLFTQAPPLLPNRDLTW